MNNFLKIFDSLGKSKKSIYLFLFLILISAVLEIFGVALIVPVLSLILTSESIFIFDYSFFNYEIYFQIDRKILINYTVIFVLIFFLLKSAFLTYFNYWRSKFIFSLNEKLSNKIFSTYLKLPYLFHLKRNSSTSTRNLLAIQNFVRNIDQLAHLVTEFIILLSFIILLFIYEPQITIFMVIIGFLFYYIYNKIVSPINFNIGKKSHEASRDILNTIKQGLMGIKDIKLYGREENFYSEFKKTIKRFSKSLTTYEFLQPIPKIILEFLAVFLIIITVVILIFLKYENNEILIFIALLGAVGFKLIPSLNKVISAIQHLKYYLPLTDSIIDELKLNSKIEKISIEDIHFNKNLKFNNVSYSYDNKKIILDKINLTISKNENIGIIGKTGSGKSTLINLVLGLIKPSSGEILIDEKKESLNSRSWQNKIGFVPQNVYLINDSIKKNIAFGLNELEISEEKIKQASEVSQLDEFINTLPNGLETIIDENGSNLSGGQVQRIGIARALYGNPDILVFDEPSSALDNFTEDKLFKAIKDISNHKSIIIISHKLSTLNFCDQIYKIENKKIINIY
ncbi:ABC transporter ATP-binding protein [Pelagibacterales bacterium SAG-MED33]|nr:ABC transporter ATP-binding protein [Pelagibacterales bacterium SAG-MED33]